MNRFAASLIGVLFFLQISFADCKVSAWRDYQLPRNDKSGAMQVSVDTDGEEATVVRLSKGKTTWKAKLQFTYFIDTKEKTKRFHAVIPERDAPWSVDTKVKAEVRINGKWIDTGKIIITRTD